ncbi:SEC-C domain-containing protein [Listeria seeligeri]|uniref:YecA family protein n=1 Tax=Listeria seeligeri TaxID=1640 RepID=UPI0018871D6B|nr:SEC-C metal-binding domain-containing protein [Listeria seeligeri]MBF2599171.1 SEC-C domain-containing protein [Listeria seeligeri]
MKKVGRNELCPCGSGKKFKRCHLDVNKIEEDSIEDFVKKYKKLNKEKRIKQCLYPDHTKCSDKIIRAHSIQNNKIIQRLSENGNVYMNKGKSNNPIAVFTKWGRKEATTFTGFCGYHDKVVFQPIEDRDFNMTDEQIFLHTYRCLAANMHDKQEHVKFGESAVKKFSLPAESDFGLLNFGNRAAVNDFSREKTIFDKALMSGTFDVLGSIVWEFDFPIQFAGSAFEAPTRDLRNQKIKNPTNDNIISHLFITIFPENEKSYCIISWLNESQVILNELIEQIKSLDESQRRNYLNVTLVKNSDNLVFSPNLIESMSKDEEANFGFFSQGAFLLEALFESEEVLSTDNFYISHPGYDLFLLR